jgi:hypothetical protein
MRVIRDVRRIIVADEPTIKDREIRPGDNEHQPQIDEPNSS